MITAIRRGNERFDLAPLSEDLMARLMACTPVAVDFCGAGPCVLNYFFEADDAYEFRALTAHEVTRVARALAREEGAGVVVVGADLVVRIGSVSVHALCHTPPTKPKE